MLPKQLSWSTIKSRTARLFQGEQFPGSKQYWEQRYALGGNSGAGSYGNLAKFKAQVLNEFVENHKIQSVIEFGCGDGHQLSLTRFPSYFGVDISETALAQCRSLYRDDPTKRFGARPPRSEKFDLALSLDVIFHLIEDNVFDAYMHDLFRYSRRFVMIYASNIDNSAFELRYGPSAPHVRHRNFVEWISRNAQIWSLLEHKPPPFPFDPERPTETTFSEFFVFILS